MSISDLASYRFPEACQGLALPRTNKASANWHPSWTALIAATATCVSVGLSGCGSEGEGAVETSTDERGIHGAVSYGAACLGNDRYRIWAAILHIRNQVTSIGFKQCLGEAFILDVDDDTVEDIVFWANTHLPVVVDCVDSSVTPCGDASNPGSYGKAGCAGETAPNAPEALWLDFGHIRNSSTPVLAETIAHEIMHNHGWFHPHSVGFSVSDQVGACVARGRPQGLLRQSVGDEFAMSPLGGIGGSVVGHRCASNEVATGIRGSTKNGKLNRLGLTCGRVTGAGIVGSYDDADGSLNAPAGSTTFTEACPSGQVLVALGVRHDSIVHAVRPFCAHLSSLRADQPATAISHVGASHGVLQGVEDADRCKHAGAVTGLNLRVGALVDRVQVECETLPRGASRRDRDSISTQLGGIGGKYFERQCQGGTVMTGIFGSRDSSDRLASVGATCRTMTGNVIGEGRYDQHRTEAAGRFAGTAFHVQCPADEVVVGYQGRGLFWMRSVVPLCVRYDWWLSNFSSPAPAAPLPSTGNVITGQCPLGQVATGIQGREGAIVDRFMLRCEYPEGSPLTSGTFGAGSQTGGSPFVQMCPGGGPLGGLLSQSNASGLVSIGAYCPVVRGNEVHVHNGVRLPQYGGIGVADDDAMCGSGSMLVGVNTRVSNGIIRGVQGICQARSDVLSKSMVSTLMSWRGDSNGGILQQQRCPTGRVAIGLEGRSGALVDRLQLVCSYPEVEFGEWFYVSVSASKDTYLKFYRPTEGNTTRVTIEHVGLFVPISSVDVDLQQRSRPFFNHEITASSSGTHRITNARWWTYNRYFSEDHYLLKLKKGPGASAYVRVRLTTN